MLKIDQEKIAKFLNSDRAMLTVCIIMALFFWLLIKLSKNFSTTYEHTIYYNLPQGKTFKEQPPKTIKSLINGSGWDLISNFFSTNESSVVINLSNESVQTISQGQLKNKLSRGFDSKNIRISEINYEYIQIELDEELIKKVPIIFNGDIKYANNHFAKDSILLQPDSVSLTGPVELLATIDSWTTEHISLTDLDKDYQNKIKLNTENQENIVLSEMEVDLTIPVEHYTEKAVFVPISIVNAVDSLNIFPEAVKLSFLVGLSRFNEVDPTAFIVEVDAKELAKAQNNTVALQLKSKPDYLRSIKMNPKSVEFFFLKNEVKEVLPE